MSKSKASGPPSAKESYKFPSHYGSHAMMIESDQELAAARLEHEDETPEKLAKRGIVNPVVLKDEFGHYVTDRSRLDNGGADPNRYAEKRLDQLFAGTQKEKDK